MRIRFDTSEVGESRWYEYFVRFVFGGAVTALAGIIAKHWGPEIGGLFLAFPAIFPATATLIQKNEERKKKQLGQEGVNRGREAAGLDATGATIGSIGLMTFSVTVWRTIPDYPLSIVLPGATLAWLISSVAAWEMWQIVRRRIRVNKSADPSAATQRNTKRARVR